MKAVPLVSISCITYNHEAYIRQCLDGFLMQQTDFAYEILIHDDASTDRTIEIIREYEAKYPDIIKPMCQTENQYSKGVRGINIRFNFSRAKGKYIAMCEGDDYWVDPLKLQKQIDFLEKNPDYTFSMGRVDHLIEKTGKIVRVKEKYANPEKKETYVLRDYLKGIFSQTSSFVFRNESLHFPDWAFQAFAGDQTLVIVATGDGKIKYHKDLFSIYRINTASVSFTVPQKAIYDNGLFFMRQVDLYTKHKYRTIMQLKIWIFKWTTRYHASKNPIEKISCRLLAHIGSSILQRI